MRPDKKKRNRGKHAERSEDTQAQGKSVDLKGVPEKEEVTKTKTEESTKQNQTESTDKAKLSSNTPTDVSNDSVPAPPLRRETDALKETKKPSKRQIFSDWKEYDKPILPEEVEDEQFHDFSSLIQQNISEDNYFKFKHERQWEKDNCNINKDLFNLNLQELSTGLQCIPFYEILNISTDLFSKHEVKRMENCAKEQEKLYERNLNLQEEEKYCVEEREHLTSESIVSQGGKLPLENELMKCLTSEKQNHVDEIPLIQPKDSKVEGSKPNFFESDEKPIVEDSVRENNIVENKLNPSQEENPSVTETSTISMSISINDLEVKHESEEVVTESIVNPSDVAPIETDVTESSPMDMNTVFESSPLGQRVKPRRSRETKAKKSDESSEVVASGEEDKILDSLLSLKEPTITTEDSKKKEIVEIENEGDNLTNDLKSIVIHEKKENLEAWLDSMLDD